MIILMTLLIAGASMAFAVHQWRRGYHLIAIGFITFACLIAGVAIEPRRTTRMRKPQRFPGRRRRPTNLNTAEGPVRHEEINRNSARVVHGGVGKSSKLLAGSTR
jgi:hypothetical protein